METRARLCRPAILDIEAGRAIRSPPGTRWRPALGSALKALLGPHRSFFRNGRPRRGLLSLGKLLVNHDHIGAGRLQKLPFTRRQKFCRVDMHYDRVGVTICEICRDLANSSSLLNWVSPFGYGNTQGV